MDDETLHTLTKARDEIRMLRQRVAELEPKAEAYAALLVLTQRLPSAPSRAYGEDVAWQIDRLIADRTRPAPRAEE